MVLSPPLAGKMARQYFWQVGFVRADTDEEERRREEDPEERMMMRNKWMRARVT